MAAPIQVFKVLTEFRFEIGAAVAGTDLLTSRVDKLSTAAGDALFSFERLGFGIVAQFSGAGGGILGLLGNAIRSADQFRRSQLAFSTILALNKENLIGPLDTFSDRLLVSEEIMKRINQVAGKFALPAGQLLQFTKLMSPILLQKGLAGVNLEAAIDVSRGILKAAPTLGLDPSLIEGQLLRLIEGQASSGDPLFRRLRGETGTFREAGIKAPKAFNILPVAKRFDLLRRALNEFANQSEEVEANTLTLNGQFRLLQDQLAGVFSIFRKLGEAFLTPIIKVLSEANKIIGKEGKQIADGIAKFIGPLIENPRKLLINLIELKQLRETVDRTGSTSTFLGITLFFATFGKFLKGIPVIGGLLFALTIPLQLLGKLANFATIKLFGLAGGAGLLSRFVVLLSRLFVPLAALFGVFETFSRAAAIAKVRDLERVPGIIVEFIILINRAKVALDQIFSPFVKVINAAAEFIAPLFSISFLFDQTKGSMESFVEILEFLGKIVVLARAGFQGLIFSILSFVEDLGDLKLAGIFGRAGDAFAAGAQQVLEEQLGAVSSGQGVVNQVTNIGSMNVKINNQFKENLEPDRIAFTLTEQLQKIARNPTQARGRSLDTGSLSSAGGF